MAQRAIYLDEDTAAELDAAATLAGQSRSAWVCEAIKEKLRDRRKEQLMATWGTWLDDRTPEEILQDIKDVPKQRERASFD